MSITSRIVTVSVFIFVVVIGVFVKVSHDVNHISKPVIPVTVSKKIINTPGLMVAAQQTKDSLAHIQDSIHNIGSKPWTIEYDTSMIDGQYVMIIKNAEGNKQYETNVKIPAINIRCSTTTTPEVYIDKLHNPLRQVRWKFDTSGVEAKDWVKSTDNTALYSPEPERTIVQALTSNYLMFEYIPDGGNGREYKFDLRQLRSAVGKIGTACNWKSSKK